MKNGSDLSLNFVHYASQEIDATSVVVMPNDEEMYSKHHSTIVAWRHIKASSSGISQPWYIRLQDHR